jgi:four helix bundle protein
MPSFQFTFESLDVYKVSISVNRRLARLRWPAGRSHLRDQALRASDSIVLNLAEGWARGRHSKAGKNHFRIARGSAGEVLAVADLLDLGDPLKQDLRRIAAMLTALTR